MKNINHTSLTELKKYQHTSLHHYALWFYQPTAVYARRLTKSRQQGGQTECMSLFNCFTFVTKLHLQYRAHMSEPLPNKINWLTGV